MTPSIRAPTAVLVLLLAGGTLGYVAIEGWSLLDSVYMTVITITTVGFREVGELSPAGKLFTSGLILVGVGALAVAARNTFEALLARRVIYHRRMQMEIKRIDGHVVVCGYGRMGSTVCDDLAARGCRVVVVERDEERCRRLQERNMLHVQGDATDDATLAAAGLERATALAAVLRDDAANLFVTLTARTMNPGLAIVARASAEKSESKMLAAGATRVLNPYRNGGRLLVRQLLHPSVTEFFDVINSGQDPDLHLEEVTVAAGSSLAEVTLRDAPIRQELDIIVVGVRRPEGELLFNPSPDLAPRAGDVLIVLGRTENLAELEKAAMGPAVHGQ
ncbi:MAG: potassium channel protein [bacterium]|nr:potassium channel protein [bacterium]